MLSSAGLRLLEPGDLIEGKYRVIRQIGEGGMGAVFEGEALRIHRRIAIKVLFPHAGSEDELARRFQLEAQAAGRIGSSHIVEVIDLGVLPSGSHFMVMELLDGESLRGRIQSRGRLRPEEIYPIALQLLDGLAAAHNAGILHRDLKPDNVFLVRQPQGDFVKLLDFGISKFGVTRGGTAAAEMSLTRTGTLLGTPYYMSPEQASGGKATDHRADLYAVGVILYEALTGVVPFQADTFNELIFKIVLEQPRSALSVVPNADPAFVKLIERAMAREPAQRFQSAEELRAALTAWATNTSPDDAVRFSTTAGRASVGDMSLSSNTPGIWARTGERGDGEVDFLTPRKSRAPLLWAGAVSALLLSGVGLAFALRSKDDSTTNLQHPSSQPNPTTSVAQVPTAPVPVPPPVVDEPPPVAVEPPPLAQVGAQTPEKVRPRAPSGRTQPRTAVTPSAVAAPPIAAAPPAQPSATPPKTDDVGRTRGGRTIRTDL
jgi:eukaryotic-like serine/threonine-protein kinase